MRQLKVTFITRSGAGATESSEHPRDTRPLKFHLRMKISEMRKSLERSDYRDGRCNRAGRENHGHQAGRAAAAAEAAAEGHHYLPFDIMIETAKKTSSGRLAPGESNDCPLGGRGRGGGGGGAVEDLKNSRCECASPRRRRGVWSTWSQRLCGIAEGT